MNVASRSGLIALFFLLALSSMAVEAADGSDEWAPTPPRLGFVDGEVSFGRPGAEAWARAQVNLALAEGDALYTGNDANFEVQFGSRSFVRADEHTQLTLLLQEARRIQFKLTSGRVSFDLRSVAAGDVLEVSTPDAVFVIEHPGYYRVEVGRGDTHFITRRGGEATVITADGRSLSIYPSEDIVVTAGSPVKVATYAAPPPDAWDRWNDARSDRIDDSVSARYLPPGVYGTDELDRYGRWRVVPTYGPVWIPYGVSATWVPYSTGYWIWDPYYEWTWVDDAPWGWAPFHYGRWVWIDGFWAWAPGPVVRRPVYAPALVAFMVRGHDVSLRVGVGLPGLWWVALSWGEPVLPWWGLPYRRWQPYWGGWGGPRIVNNIVISQTTVIKTHDIHFHNASLPRAILTVPPDRFGRERVRATVENRFRHTEFAPASDALPVRPARASLVGGAPRGVQPPPEVVARPVVSTRMPRERVPEWQGDAVQLRTRETTESRVVVPSARRAGEARVLQRPSFGAETGPERTPLPPPPRYGDIRKSTPEPAPAATREPGMARSREATREQAVERREVRVPSPPPAVKAAPQRDESRQDRKERSLPGQPASQTYRGRGQENREAR